MQPKCGHPGCTRPRSGHTQYCSVHRRGADRAYKARRDPDNGFYSSDTWRAFRAEFLGTNPVCSECGGIADTIHHIVPRTDAPDRALDPTNCLPLCKTCHGIHHAGESHEFGQSKKPNNITLVCGPPGSGTLEYVYAHKRHGDVVIDYNLLVAAISGAPLYEAMPMVADIAHAARNAILERLMQQQDGVTAWVTGRLPRASLRTRLAEQLQAKTVLLAAEPRDCAKRLRADPIRAKHLDQWLPAIDDWWSKHQATHTSDMKE
jgi:5-methylcytosine-specific restriction endonuclease McrA